MHEFVPTPVSELRPGDLIDLEGDLFADPKRGRMEFNFEYQTVADVVPETSGCIAVGLEGIDVFGFPPGHYVRLIERADHA